MHEHSRNTRALEWRLAQRERGVDQTACILDAPKPITMRTLAFISALTIGATLHAQKPKDIDMKSCDPGYRHRAKGCGGCGHYTGEVLLCKPSANVRAVEIIVPQVFKDSTRVKLKGKPRPMNGGKGVRFKLSAPIKPRTEYDHAQIAPQWETVDGSMITEDYYLHYKIKGH